MDKCTSRHLLFLAWLIVLLLPLLYFDALEESYECLGYIVDLSRMQKRLQSFLGLDRVQRKSACM